MEVFAIVMHFAQANMKGSLYPSGRATYYTSEARCKREILVVRKRWEMTGQQMPESIKCEKMEER